MNPVRITTRNTTISADYISAGLLSLLLLAAFLLTFAIVETSVYLRLHEAGAGCADWPRCYGYVLDARTDTGAAPRKPLKIIHRGMASLLVLLAGLIAYRVFRDKTLSRKAGKVAIQMIALLVALSVLGPFTPLKQYPLIAVGNSILGLLLLLVIARLAWTTVAPPPVVMPHAPRLRRCAAITLYLAIGIYFSGIWSSANYTAVTVETDLSLFTLSTQAINPLRELAFDHDHRIQADAAMPLIRITHKLAALFFVCLGTSLCAALMRDKPALRRLAALIMALMLFASILGYLSSVGNISIGLSLGHQIATVALVLALFRLNFLFPSKNHKPENIQ